MSFWHCLNLFSKSRKKEEQESKQEEASYIEKPRVLANGNGSSEGLNDSTSESKVEWKGINLKRTEKGRRRQRKKTKEEDGGGLPPLLSASFSTLIECCREQSRETREKLQKENIVWRKKNRWKAGAWIPYFHSTGFSPSVREPRSLTGMRVTTSFWSILVSALLYLF